MSVDAYKCERCGHIWLPKNLPGKTWDGKLDTADKAKVCPLCKSAYWNTLRKVVK